MKEHRGWRLSVWLFSMRELGKSGRVIAGTMRETITVLLWHA